MRIEIKCPHCQESCFGRDSAQLTRTTKEVKCVCKNADCGHTFIAYFEVTKTLSLSAKPHPDVNIPLSKRLQNLN